MALPTFVALGATSGSLTAISPALPAGIATNDILVMIMDTARTEAAGLANEAGGTWNLIDFSEGATNAPRITGWWSRYNGTQTAPTSTDSGNHQMAFIAAIRGCLASGDPVGVSSKGLEDTSDTTVSMPGATTPETDCFVLACGAINEVSVHSQITAGDEANADLANFTSRRQVGMALSLGATLVMFTGEKATAGAFGATTMTLGLGSQTKAYLTIALKSANPSAAVEDDDTLLLLGVS